MPTTSILELTKILLPTCVGAAFGWLLLRRLEEVKSEVVRYSDFSRRWAELFFEASNTFMVSVERFITLYSLLARVRNPNDEWGTSLQGQANDLLPVMFETSFRIQRLVVLVPNKGSAAETNADRIIKRIEEITATKKFDHEVLRHEINQFNRAAREAHAEMLASRIHKAVS